jgi:polysaccharide biosynthesis protein PslG
VRRTFLAAAMMLTLAALAAPVAHAKPASQIAGVALHPWQLQDNHQRDRVFDGIAATGAKWVRVDMPWAWVEAHGPTLKDGHGHWGGLDPIVTAAKLRGLKIIGIVAYTPEWASEIGHQWAYPDREAFETFFEAALRRYPQIPAWELWNEPNFERFSKPEPNVARFVDLLRSARRVRDAVGSKAKLISGGLAPGGDIDIVPWVNEMAMRGGLSLIDGLGVHPYSRAAPDDPRSQMMQLEALHRRLGQLGRPDLPLWLTEYGAPSIGVENGYAPALTEAQQAARLRTAFTLASRFDWIENLTWYEYRDNETGSSNPDDNFGLVHSDLSPKPAYSTFRDVVAGATSKLQARLTLYSRFSQARVKVVRPARAAKRKPRHEKKRKRVKRKVVKRKLVNRIAVTGRLTLPGTAWPDAPITVLLPRVGAPPLVKTVIVKEGYFWARFEGRALTSGTVQVRYGGSTAYLPVTTTTQVVSEPARVAHHVAR